jgi:hypothetical protein
VAVAEINLSNEPPAPGLPEPDVVLIIREMWRGTFAFGLLVLLAIVSLIVLLNSGVDSQTADKVVPPLFALAGSVVGYYFGTKSNDAA